MADDAPLSRGWDVVDPDFHIGDLPFDNRFRNLGSIMRPGYFRSSGAVHMVELLGKKRFDDGAFAAFRNRGTYPWRPVQLPRRPSAWSRLPFDVRFRLGVALVLAVLLAIAVIGATIDENRRAAERPPFPTTSPSPRVSPTGETSIATLSAEERALITITDWELFRGERLDAFVITLAAPGLDHPLVRGRLEVEITDDDGVSHALQTGYASLTHGEPSVVVIAAMVDDDVDVVALEGTFRPSIVYDLTPAYDVELADVDFTSADSRGIASGTLITTPTSDGSPVTATITTIVRDPTGTIQNVGIATARTPAPGESVPVTITLLAPRMPSPTDAVHHQLNLR